MLSVTDICVIWSDNTKKQPGRPVEGLYSHRVLSHTTVFIQVPEAVHFQWMTCGVALACGRIQRHEQHDATWVKGTVARAWACGSGQKLRLGGGGWLRLRLRFRAVDEVPADEVEGGNGVFDGTVTRGACRLDRSPQELLRTGGNDQYASHDPEDVSQSTHSALSARLYGGPCVCGNSATVSTQRWWIMRSVFRSFSSACPMTIV